MEKKGKESLFGLSENIVAAAGYVFSPISSLLLLVFERENKFVRFHAMQSFIFFLGLYAVTFICGFIPLLGGMISWLSGIITFAATIFFGYQALTGKYYKIPVIGEVAYDSTNK